MINQMPGVARQEARPAPRFEEPASAPAAAAEKPAGGKRGLGCVAKGCLVVLALHAIFMIICILIACVEYKKEYKMEKSAEVSGEGAPESAEVEN